MMSAATLFKLSKKDRTRWNCCQRLRSVGYMPERTDSDKLVFLYTPAPAVRRRPARWPPAGPPPLLASPPAGVPSLPPQGPPPAPSPPPPPPPPAGLHKCHSPRGTSTVPACRVTQVSFSTRHHHGLRLQGYTSVTLHKAPARSPPAGLHKCHSPRGASTVPPAGLHKCHSTRGASTVPACSL
eukprot:1196051-Prorocentrum_minimum.AAC.4